MLYNYTSVFNFGFFPFSENRKLSCCRSDCTGSCQH